MPAITTSIQEFQEVIDYLDANPANNVTATIMVRIVKMKNATNTK